MDNRIFNVNGAGEQMLLDTLKLVFTQEGDNTTCKAWKQTDEHGLLLLWWHEDRDKTNPFPAPMTAEQCLPFVTAWLKSDAAKKVKLGGTRQPITMAAMARAGVCIVKIGGT